MAPWPMGAGSGRRVKALKKNFAWDATAPVEMLPAGCAHIKRAGRPMALCNIKSLSICIYSCVRDNRRDSAILM